MADDPNMWRTIFSDQSVILAFFGALGGSVRAVTLRTSWREGLRVVFVGGATAFGAGVLAPTLLRPYFGELPDGAAGALGTLGASAFLLGLIAVTLIERALDRKEEGVTLPKSGMEDEQ